MTVNSSCFSSGTSPQWIRQSPRGQISCLSMEESRSEKYSYRDAEAAGWIRRSAAVLKMSPCSYSILSELRLAFMIRKEEGEEGKMYRFRSWTDTGAGKEGKGNS